MYTKGIINLSFSGLCAFFPVCTCTLTIHTDTDTYQYVCMEGNTRMGSIYLFETSPWLLLNSWLHMWNYCTRAKKSLEFGREGQGVLWFGVDSVLTRANLHQDPSSHLLSSGVVILSKNVSQCIYLIHMLGTYCLTYAFSERIQPYSRRPVRMLPEISCGLLDCASCRCLTLTDAHQKLCFLGLRSGYEATHSPMSLLMGVRGLEKGHGADWWSLAAVT